jgi:outer membrane protein
LISSKDAARASRIGRDAGLRSFVEVLDADRQVFEVARDLAIAKHEYIMGSLRLKTIAGQLSESEDDLAELNTRLVSTAAP